MKNLNSGIGIRGIVEGFYGTPWTHETRMAMIPFLAGEQMNAYIYAPKDDPYHRAQWRHPYPEEKLSELRELASECRKNGVHCIFAVSPGLDVHLHGEKMEEDVAFMIHKLHAVQEAGILNYAVFFDDIEDDDGAGQAAFVNRIARETEAFRTLPLITVSKTYWRKSMEHAGMRSAYADGFHGTLSPDVLLLYTGNGVVCPGISDAEMTETAELMGRTPSIWWNYPVNDYAEGKLALGPVSDLPKSCLPPAFFINPMKYPWLSRIAIATGAAYARDPAAYQPEETWRTVIRKQYGDLAEDMMAFAAQSQHLETTWRDEDGLTGMVGWPDGTALREQMDRVLQGGETAALRASLSGLCCSVKRLQECLPEAVLSECSRQLIVLQRQCEDCITACEILEDARHGRKTDPERIPGRSAKETDRHAVRVSQGVSDIFPQEVYDLLSRQADGDNMK